MTTQKKKATTRPKRKTIAVIREEFQNDFDLKKMQDSALNQSDTCGSYDICNNCDIKLDFPCARASEKTAKAKTVVL